MNKNQWAALVNTLCGALDDARIQRQHAEAAAQRAEMEKQAAFQQLRTLQQFQEQRTNLRRDLDQEAPLPSRRIAMEDSVYRPAREGETPHILVSDLREGTQARDLPYVKVR